MMSENDWRPEVEAVRTLIRFIGDDPDREDLKDTPRRFLSAWLEYWGTGYSDGEPSMRIFNASEYNELVLQRDIQYFSHCEHHMAPFFGTIDIAYLPRNGIVGLSKLSRAVNFFARRLQTQERLVCQIAEFLAKTVSADVAVVAHGRHLCMMSRGVQQHEAITTTSAIRGVFFESPVARQEFIGLLNSSKRS